MRTEALAVLVDHPVFGVLPAEHLNGVLDEPAIIEFSSGDALFRQGDAAERLYVLIRGQVDIAVERSGHPPEILSRLGPGEAVGADSIIPDNSHAAGAVAVDNVRAAVVSARRLIAVLDADFDKTLTLIAAMAGSLRGLIKEITELKLQSTTERLAGYLTALAGPDAKGRVQVRLPVEKRLLADRLGMEPATLSRAFAKLRDWGVETGRGDLVLIRDIAPLRELGEALLMEGDDQ